MRGLEGKSRVWIEYEIQGRLELCFSRVEVAPEDEYTLRKLLEKCFHEVLEGIPIQIIPHLPREEKRPGCPRILFVLVGTRNFADRTLEALEVARRCRGIVEGVIYLTISWSMNLENRLRSIAAMFRDYGVLDICRREPRAHSTIIWY
ncbi:MAG: hypothetical protein QXF61_05675 [Nitrososphaeria archaeon]